MKIIKLCLFALFLASKVSASDEKPPTNASENPCEDALTSQGYRVISSGEDLDLFPKYEETFRLLFGDGILKKLGVTLNPVIATFVQGGDMDILAAQGRPSLPFWSEGRDIIRQIQASGFLYEFVASGNQPHRPFFRDTVNPKEQVSIILHVIGHLHFSLHSRLHQADSEIDSVGEALELARYLDACYQRYDHDQVQSWYQLLESLKLSQDMIRGNQETPDDFGPQDTLQDPKKIHTQRPPTANILQAFVANLPPDTLEWQREIAKRYERLHRHYAGNVVTKIMNEGWAALWQEMGAEHTPYSDFNHAFAFGDLMKGVARPSLSNPYFLGREAWRRIRAKFNNEEFSDQQKVKGLSPIERDAAFIQYATAKYIKNYDDYSFLLEALDAQWIQDNHWMLGRPWDWDKDGSPRNPPPQDDPDLDTLKIIKTRDPKRITRAIVRKVADRRFQIPRVALLDLNKNGTGVIALGWMYEVGGKIPLKQGKTAKTLYVYSQFMERPVSLEAVVPAKFLDESTTPDYPVVMPYRWWWDQEPEKPPQAARIVVEPSGKVTVYAIKINAEGKTTEEINKKHTDYLQKSVDNFKLND
ncbi:MAG: SpoVR family protein, partial [Deltaproteobacteria bacterium]|nr:SpoVR family protein [Deltaproteobacteria bacterium]